MNTKLKKVQKNVVTPFLDMLLGRTISKKLMVFLIATTFVALSYLNSSEWVEVAKWYVASQSTVDIALALKGNKKDDKIERNNSEAR